MTNYISIPVLCHNTCPTVHATRGTETGRIMSKSTTLSETNRSIIPLRSTEGQYGTNIMHQNLLRIPELTQIFLGFGVSMAEILSILSKKKVVITWFLG